MHYGMWLFSDHVHGLAFTVMLVKQNPVLKCLHYQRGNSNRMCVMYISPWILLLKLNSIIYNKLGI